MSWTRTEHGLVINEKIIPWGAVWPKDSGAYKKGAQYKACLLYTSRPVNVAALVDLVEYTLDGIKGSISHRQHPLPGQRPSSIIHEQEGKEMCIRDRYNAALCRERADWMVGINASRLFSCLYSQPLAVGRVMTLSLIHI